MNISIKKKSLKSKPEVTCRASTGALPHMLVPQFSTDTGEQSHHQSPHVVRTYRDVEKNKNRFPLVLTSPGDVNNGNGSCCCGWGWRL